MEPTLDTPTGPAPSCTRCHTKLGSQMVKAMDESFHPECFTCMDCNALVASQFFPFTTETGETFPLCERDYFRRLGLVCETCHEALRGAYIIALDKKYHTHHFTCGACSVEFGPNDSYYEHNGQVFCHFDYSVQFAVMCAGCEMAILKQYVEIDRKDDVEHWHPECYMIHKYWNVRIAQPSVEDSETSIQKDRPHHSPGQLLEKQHETEEKVFRIWQVLSAFEESSAVCISEMLLHVSNGNYVNGICLSERFLIHVEALFSGIDELCKIYSEYNQPEFKYTREAKMLCKKIINFFSLMWRTQEVEMRKLGISQELLSLVTGLAHYLKLLIRVALTAALRLDLTVGKPVAVSRLLAKLMEVAGRERHSRDSQRLIKAKEATDCCHACKQSIEDQCMKYGQYRWHIKCFACRQCKRPLAEHTETTLFSLSTQSLVCAQCSSSKDGGFVFEYVTKLVQYAFLLRVALSRLCSLLQITDQQLSAVDYSSKTKIQLPKDALGKDIVTYTVEKQQVVSQYVDEKLLHYPTHIADTNMMSATKLERKMSRSFKTAKRSTILGNTSTNNAIPENKDEAYTEAEGETETDTTDVPLRTAPDMSVEGVFRKNGNIRRLKELTEQLDKNPHDVDLASENAIQIAALLKKFLRELPDPLLTFKLHGLFTCAQRMTDPVARKHVLHLACCMLPRCNRDTLEVLFLFLRWVASFSHVTTDVGSRMDIPNLARVIAPNILTTDSKDPVKDDSFSAIRVVEILLESYEDFCLVPEELESFLQDPSLNDAKTMEISSRDFLKKVEQLMKQKKQTPSSGSIQSPSLVSSTDLRFFDGVVDGRQPPPTSIYTQQHFLPYSNHHPSSDFYTLSLPQRQASLKPSSNISQSSLSSMNSYHRNNPPRAIPSSPSSSPYTHSPLNSAQHVTSQ
ncbi:hypothetical protein BDF14DRAFT_1776310 [Spinellus fusiger]|nr:hypothetical protein BDF14DRAFT_1776310 [Spinellus fusiger]